MNIKTSLRFKIFERDNFTCQYCGKKPPEIILHCDHIHPKSKGGTSDEINLITSCRDCNLGKKDKILKNPQRPDIKQEVQNLQEAEKQIKEYYKYLKKLKNYKENNPVIDLLCNTWYEESNFTDEITKNDKKFLKNLTKKYLAEDIIEAIKITWENERIDGKNKWRYMLGVLKHLKLKRDDPELAEKIKKEKQEYYFFLNYWQNQPRGSGYLPEHMLKQWLQDWDKETILQAMDDAKGIWNTLKMLLNP